MIERQNWLDVRAYLDYCARVLQLDDKTTKRKRTHLRHLLEWADNTPFQKARAIDPTFPVYLRRARNDGQARQLSPETMSRACEEGRRFLTWARAEYPARYRAITEGWIRTIKPDRAHGRQSEIEARILWDLSDVVKIASFEASTLTEQRDIAATCFLFLSGMRIDAFITLPIDCVNLSLSQVRQLPGRGVRTKNHKAAITYLLAGDDLSVLVESIAAWDSHVRACLPSSALWYPFLDTEGEITDSTRQAGIDRASIYRKGLRRLCDKAGVEYKSPHKLRHGHAVYAIKKASTIAQLKAISQNLMHRSLTITDGLYGVLTAESVGENIKSLGASKSNPTGVDLDTLKAALQELLKI